MMGLVSVGGVKLGPECQALAWALVHFLWQGKGVFPNSTAPRRRSFGMHRKEEPAGRCGGIVQGF